MPNITLKFPTYTPVNSVIAEAASELSHQGYDVSEPITPAQNTKEYMVTERSSDAPVATLITKKNGNEGIIEASGTSAKAVAILSLVSKIAAGYGGREPEKTAGK